jgi:elongation factor Tu
LSTEKGGRVTPVARSSGAFSYRPNHNFSNPESKELSDGFINLEPGVVVRPGESAEVEIVFFSLPLDADLFLGREWRIQEGSRLVGIGTVLEILADPWRPS